MEAKGKFTSASCKHLSKQSSDLRLYFRAKVGRQMLQLHQLVRATRTSSQNQVWRQRLALLLDVEDLLGVAHSR